MNNFKNMWDFPVMEGVSFSYANRVHPLMQKRVDTLVHALKKDHNIRKVVLFGSSLEFRCDSYSDIDLYIEKYDKEKKTEEFPELDCEVDIITNLSHESRLYQEIDRTGLLLFERTET
ncbi:MAG: nucleotidyltransferase domain-containing protein [Lachnospiraceae bacterium]|nr:nucleotidyltransferase domain-containing protein [Lachnospiraceae bacterium]